MARPTCWLIRAGERSRHAGRFVDHDVVALGWPNVDGLGNFRDMTTEEIRGVLSRAALIGTPGQDTTELVNFRDEVRTGDIVITPDARVREILVGEVAGDYEYRDPSPAADYKHVRRVHWLGAFDRESLPRHLATETNWQRSIRRLRHQDEWRVLAEGLRWRDVRSAQPRRRV